MSAVKLTVLYPKPKDAAEFERRYAEEHMPMAMKNLTTATKVVLSVFKGAPMGEPAFYRMAELHFASMDALQAALGSPGGQATAAHAIEISTGGMPVFLIGGEQVMTP